jgi:type I restriction enzyme R subunit
MNEAQTKFEFIDPGLKDAGWGIVSSSRLQKQFPITKGRLIGNNKRSKPLRADYVLVYKNQILAVIEGKSDE